MARICPSTSFAFGGTLAALALLSTSGTVQGLQCPKGYIGAPGPKCVRGVPTVTPQRQVQKPKPASTSNIGVSRQKMSITPEPNAPSAEQRAAQQRAAEQRAAQQRAAEQRAAEQRAAEQRAAQQRAAEQRAAEQRAAEQRAAQQRAAEQRAAAQRAAEQRAVEQRAAEERAAERRAAEQRAERAEAERKAKREKMTISNSPNTPDNDDQKSKKKPVARSDDDTGTGKPKSAEARDDDSGNRKGAKTTDDDAGSGKKAAKAAERSPPATTASLAAGAAWTHNNSRMSVANDGNEMTIAYDAPRDGLSALGIKPGTPLFKGTRDGNKVTGEATTFTRKCGTRTYPVSGTLANGRVELSGDKPVLDGDCGVSSTTRERLVFETDN